MTTTPTPNGAVADLDAIVVGAGFAGLRALHVLRGDGLSVRLFEAGGDVGGTWYWNRYPGVRVDIESLEYSYSFDDALQQEWNWTERYASGPEVRRYLGHVADRLDLRKDITFDTRVVSTVYDEDTQLWTVGTDTGRTLTVRYVVMAVGFLSAAYTPPFPGLDSFEGELIHTGRWPHENVDFAGKRVAIIGSGATSVQMVPVVAGTAAKLTVLQRSANWCFPLQNIPMPTEYDTRIKSVYPELRERELTESFAGNLLVDFKMMSGPTVSALEAGEADREAEFEFRWGSGGLCIYASYPDLLTEPRSNDLLRDYMSRKIREVVKDPATAEKLTPTHRPMTRRLCGETNYYAAFNRPNVELVDTTEDPIAEILSDGIRLESGTVVPVDMILLATGFDAGTGPVTAMGVIGRDGKNIADHWSEGVRAHLGVAVDGFPNLFMLDGPLSPAAYFSPPLLVNYQAQWLSRLIARLDAEGIVAIEPAPAVTEAWADLVNQIAETTLVPETDSWWFGSNIPGKPRQALYFLGGYQMYSEACEADLADLDRSFVMTRAHVEATA